MIARNPPNEVTAITNILLVASLGVIAKDKYST